MNTLDSKGQLNRELRTHDLSGMTDLSGMKSAGMMSAISALNPTAQASAVNRTHRVVRERAKRIQARRNRVRSLWLPMIICSALIVIFCSAVWSVLDEYELAPTGVPDSRYQIFVLLLWFFPVSASLLGMVWFHRSRSRNHEGAAK